MLESLRLTGYRAFDSLKINDLGLVNLFVGKNNSGKTSILEAAELLLDSSSPIVITRSASRRGELLARNGGDRNIDELDVSHLFRGHRLKNDTGFEVEGVSDNKALFIKCQISTPENQGSLFAGMSEDAEFESKYALIIIQSLWDEKIIMPVSAIGGLSKRFLRQQSMREWPETNPVTFIRTEALDSLKMSELWDSIALTSEETNVIEILKIVEPQVERIAFLSGRPRRYTSSSGGIFIKLKDFDDRIPLGSLGDGIRHLLGMSLSVIRSSGGAVMIDEIDTGLHYSVMIDMWKVLIKTAKRLKVQIFATTHSQDCLRSLAWLYEREPDLIGEVKVHRVEIDREKTTVYSGAEIATAAKHHMEIRG